mmetsp:Transcript_5100/g.11289  ORF Transcript_5100/g.11289 Transcript_5100/m.11289 type:complete len:380 (-) Transcript_5100:584-1723(-)
MDLDERHDTCSCNAAWRWCRWQWLAKVRSDLLLLGQHALGRGLVQGWVVELLEAVDSHAQELLCCPIRLHELNIGLVLLLAGLGSVSHLLVKGCNAISQGLDLLGEGGNGLLGLLNGQLQIGESLLQCLHLVLSGVELLFAVRLLLVVLALLLGQDFNKLIDESEDLLEANLLASEGHGDEVQCCPVRLVSHWCLLHQGQCPLSQLPAAGGHLDKAWTWEGLLEELQGVVIVEDLDGLCDGQLLLSAHLLNLLPLLVLGVAVLVHVGQELLILGKRLLGVLQIVSHLSDLDAKLASALSLCLNGGSVSGKLLLLGCLHISLVLLGLLLGGGDVCQVLLHLVLHDLQDANDLTTCWGIATAAALIKEGHEDVPISAVQRS